MTLRPQIPLIALTAIVFVLSLAGACERSKPKPIQPPNPKSATGPQAKRLSFDVDPYALALAKSETYQPEIKLLAWTDGKTVGVRILNATEKSLRIRDENFGLILSGRRQVFPFNPVVHTSTFPDGIDLETGQMANGYLEFPGTGDLAGQRLVFSHTYTAPSVAWIQGPNSQSPAPTPFPLSSGEAIRRKLP